jgi:succinyl-CoA synthetase beta subunit
MKIHEYKAKSIFRAYHVPAPRGAIAETPEQSREIASMLNGPVVIKAQVLAGGRGKGGGVALAHTPEEAFAAAERIIGMRLVTPQTGPEGTRVRVVLVEEAVAVAREIYLSLVVDRARQHECLVFIASPSGGMEIEEVAHLFPEKIIKVHIPPTTGFGPSQARALCEGLGLSESLQGACEELAGALYRLFTEKDASLIELNPLGVTSQGTLIALDAKVVFDDDALFRHPELALLRDEREEDPLEREARKAGVTYVRLDGTVGCLVNGAGLAMATMDLIKLAGGEPANFLDVGGGASPRQIEKAFQLLSADPHVRAVLMNIFGGILRCDRVAAGLIEAAAKSACRLPLVVRLQGTNAEEGRRLLRESGLAFEVAEDLFEAAHKAVALATA